MLQAECREMSQECRDVVCPEPEFRSHFSQLYFAKFGQRFNELPRNLGAVNPNLGAGEGGFKHVFKRGAVRVEGHATETEGPSVR